MSNKEKIAELENLISTGLDLIGVLNSKVNLADIEVDKLKKEDEVKPVFPHRGNCEGEVWHIDNFSIYYTIDSTSDKFLESLSEIGMAFHTSEDAEKELERQKSRAYVIEAINKANGGDNGFKVGELNYIVCIDPANGLGAYHGINPSEDYSFLFVSNHLYIRSVSEAKRLRADEEFVENYKTMLGIK